MGTFYLLALGTLHDDYKLKRSQGATEKGDIIYSISADLTAKCYRPIKLSLFCHRYTKKHNFQIIK